MSVSRGAVYDVAVDIDPGLGDLRPVRRVELNDDNHRQMWVPPGYAHGFCVLSEVADFQYKLPISTSRRTGRPGVERPGRGDPGRSPRRGCRQGRQQPRLRDLTCRIPQVPWAERSVIARSRLASLPRKPAPRL